MLHLLAVSFPALAAHVERRQHEYIKRERAPDSAAVTDDGRRPVHRPLGRRGRRGPAPPAPHARAQQTACGSTGDMAPFFSLQEHAVAFFATICVGDRSIDNGEERNLNLLLLIISFFLPQKTQSTTRSPPSKSSARPRSSVMLPSPARSSPLRTAPSSTTIAARSASSLRMTSGACGGSRARG